MRTKNEINARGGGRTPNLAVVETFCVVKAARSSQLSYPGSCILFDDDVALMP